MKVAYSEVIAQSIIGKANGHSLYPGGKLIQYHHYGSLQIDYSLI